MYKLPFMPNNHFNSYIARGGGGGGSKKPSKTQAQIDAEAQAAAAKKAAEEAAAKKAAEEKAAAAQKAAAEKAAMEAAQQQSADTAAAASDMLQKSVESPSELVTSANVAKIDPNETGTLIDPSAGQMTGAVPVITDPTKFNAATVQSDDVAADVKAVTDGVTAQQGTVSTDATVLAAQSDPTQMASLGLDAAQLGQAQTVTPAAARTLESGELISGSAVDMAAVDTALDVQAAQADPSIKATVQGQMAELMKDFEGTEPPAWAAGALRNATSQMAARGLGSSSMAGQALIQAAMESALPIAMQDAKTFSTFESQNLSNRQQTAMFAAQQRAKFLEIDFNQDFQTRVANAAKVSDIANMNFTAEQQIALENARLAQSVDLANLNASNAKVLADAAAMSQMDMANLNNRQQAAVMNAQSFLQMDMKNMDLQQQVDTFKAQQNIAAIFSDQAADNAAKQFNAASENQTNQFFANMSTQVQQFNAGAELQYDQFQAQNALIVAQANATWRQNASTVNAAAQNQANMAAAVEANKFTQSTLDQVWQRERDIMDYAFRQSESATDRALSVFLADKEVDLAKWEGAQREKSDKSSAFGSAIGWGLTQLTGL